MILVLLGTQHNSFERLLKEVEKCIENKVIKDDVIVQAGFTKFETDKMKILNVIPMDQLQELIIKADLIITHGGVGSITSSLKNNKKIIAIPRLKKYGEHVNDHQLQIVESFNDNGYLKGIFEMEDLAKAIEEMKEFTPKQFVSNTGNIINVIDEFIENS